MTAGDTSGHDCSAGCSHSHSAEQQDGEQQDGELGYGDLPVVLAQFQHSDSGTVYQSRPPERTVAASWGDRIAAFRCSTLQMRNSGCVCMCVFGGGGCVCLVGWMNGSHCCACA